MTPHARRTLALAFVLAAAFAACLATAAPAPAPTRAAPAGARRTTKPMPAKPATPGDKPVIELASDARVSEDNGAYALAAEKLRALRGRVAFDPDLELFLAMDEARCGQLDSAYARLSTPAMLEAMRDTGAVEHRREYPFQREPFWVDGEFTGWPWYLARTRAELALRMGRWTDALDAALYCARSRPLAGKEHLLLALAAGRAGDIVHAPREARIAASLDPMLPEAHYLSGVYAWRAGDRVAALAAMRAAIAADPAFRPAALAIARLRVPGMPPDSLPTRYLMGRRETLMLTSPMRPKPEEYVQNDVLAALLGLPKLELPDSVRARMHLRKPLQLFVTVLVDENGAPVTNELPYIRPGQLPNEVVTQVAQMVARWKFRPAVKLSRNVPSFATVQLQIDP